MVFDLPIFVLLINFWTKPVRVCAVCAHSIGTYFMYCASTAEYLPVVQCYKWNSSVFKRKKQLLKKIICKFFMNKKQNTFLTLFFSMLLIFDHL